MVGWGGAGTAVGTASLTLLVVTTLLGSVIAMLPPVSAARSTVTLPGFILAIISAAVQCVPRLLFHYFTLRGMQGLIDISYLQ